MDCSFRQATRRRSPRRRAARSKRLPLLRRAAMLGVTLVGAVLAVLALQKIGGANIAGALVNSSPTFVLLGLAVMCSSMVLRAFSWHAILKAALPRARVRMSD